MPCSFLMKSPYVRAEGLIVRKHNLKNNCLPMSAYSREEWDMYLAYFIKFLVEQEYEDNEMKAKEFLGLPPDWKEGA